MIRIDALLQWILGAVGPDRHPAKPGLRPDGSAARRRARAGLRVAAVLPASAAVAGVVADLVEDGRMAAESWRRSRA